MNQVKYKVSTKLICDGVERVEWLSEPMTAAEIRDDFETMMKDGVIPAMEVGEITVQNTFEAAVTLGEFEMRYRFSFVEQPPQE